MRMLGKVRVRFAPSPTGHLHIGGLRTAIFNWLFARHHKGVFLLRIEDTDLERSKSEYTESILASFDWMNIDYDEPVVIQSQRVTRHQEVAKYLIANNKAYYCTCTHDDIVERLSMQPGFDAQFIKYDAFCWKKKEAGNPHKSGALRFRIPEAITSITINDLILGTITIDRDQLDDFIIVRSDGTPMYNFVVIVDDADMQISHVIRGQEHIANTPKQILLYQACDFNVPEFAHLPMILAPDGSKLSKRDAATGVFEYKQLGYLPEALFNYLVRLGWAHGDQEIFSREEIIALFSLDHINKKGAVFDQQKLDWLNGLYMRQTSDERLLEIITKDIAPDLSAQTPVWNHEQRIRLVALFKERAKTLKDIVADCIAFYQLPSVYQPEDIAQWITLVTVGYLQELIAALSDLHPFMADTLNATLKNWVKTKELKIVAIAQPLRIALMGKSSGPGIYELMAIIGKDATVQRIEKFINFLTNNNENQI